MEYTPLSLTMTFSYNASVTSGVISRMQDVLGKVLEKLLGDAIPPASICMICTGTKVSRERRILVLV